MKLASLILLAFMLAGCAMQGPGEAAREQRGESQLFLGCTERGCPRPR